MIRLLILLVLEAANCMEVVMVLGGRYLDHSRQTHVELSSVEVVGPQGVCKLPDMPEPRHGHTAGVIGDKVYVCGGLSGIHIHERKDCMVYSLTEGKWERMEATPMKGLAFSAMAVGKNTIYLVGGRESLYKTSQDRPWETSSVVMEYSRVRSKENAWRSLPNMTKPGSDGCAGVIGQHLWYIGDQGVEVLRNGQQSWQRLELERVRNETYELMLRQLELVKMKLNPSFNPDKENKKREQQNKPVEFKFEQKKKRRQEKKERNHLKEVTKVAKNRVYPAVVTERDTRRSMAEERRRQREEERRRKNLRKLEQEKNPDSIWDQIRNVFDKGAKGVDEILSKGQGEGYVRRKRNANQVTRAPWVEDYSRLVTRAHWVDLQQQHPNQNSRNQQSGNREGWRDEDRRDQWRNGDRDNEDNWRNGDRNEQDNWKTGDRNEQDNWRQPDRGDDSESWRLGKIDENWSQGQRGDTGESWRRPDRNWSNVSRNKERLYPAPTRPPLGGGSVSDLHRPEERMVGQGCAVVQLDGEEGILLAGGVWEGGSRVAWVPLGRPGLPLLEEVGTLEEDRRWRPGVGRIAGRIAIVGGGDWGTDTIEVLDKDKKFQLLGHRLQDRRENTAAVTVDSSFFKGCRF